MLWGVKALYNEQIQYGKPYFSWVHILAGLAVRDLHKGIPMKHLIKIIFPILDNILDNIYNNVNYTFSINPKGGKSHLNYQLACSKIPSYSKWTPRHPPLHFLPYVPPF